MAAVGGSLVNNTMASFFDTEVSTQNEMCAGTRILELGSGPITVECGVPCKWYSGEHTLVNIGTLDGMASVHIPTEDGSSDGVQWEGLQCVEDGAKHGMVWNGVDVEYVTGTPVGAGVATSEPELGAEEGGQVGQIMVAGLGTDAGDDSGPPDWIMSKYVDVKIWFDKNGDGDFLDEGEMIVSDTLFNIACTQYELGMIPSALSFEFNNRRRGGGWGSYFVYNIGARAPALTLPLIMAQNNGVGTLAVWHDDTNLYVEYDTTSSGWEMAVTHVYVGANPPDKLAPGSFPYAHDPVTPPLTYDLYQIPLVLSGKVYIAAHAEGTDGETAWGMGVSRKFMIELHLQQVEDAAWSPGGIDYDQDGNIDDDDAQKRWWPTNAFQGDRCTFDMVFRLE